MIAGGGGRLLGEEPVLHWEAAGNELGDGFPFALNEFDEDEPSAARAGEGVDAVDALEECGPVEAGGFPSALGGAAAPRSCLSFAGAGCL